MTDKNARSGTAAHALSRSTGPKKLSALDTDC